MKFELPEDVGTQILEYLIRRPYQEVHWLIAALQQLKPIVPPQPSDQVFQEKE